MTEKRQVKGETRPSIDGIIRRPAKNARSARPQYISKQTREDEGKPFISVRPQVLNARAHGGTAEVEIVKGAGGKAVVIPKLQPLRVPKVLAQDLVVKLPRRLSFRASLLTLVQYLFLAGVAVAAGYSTDIGQWFVLAYAIYALVTRQDSRLSFGIALFVLVSIPLFQAIGQPGVANHMAVYVYELLVVGTVQALIELRREPSAPQN